MRPFGKKEKAASQEDKSGRNSVYGERLFFDYVFKFEDGEEHLFTVNLDPETLRLSAPGAP